MGNAQRPSPCRVININNNNRSTAQIVYGVGENPLNGKGVALNVKNEELKNGLNFIER